MNTTTSPATPETEPDIDIDAFELSDYASIAPQRMTESSRKTLLKIMEAATRIPSSTADVFVDWSAHTNGLLIRIYLGGWGSYREPDEVLQLYTDQKGVVKELRRALNRLESWGR